MPPLAPQERGQVPLADCVRANGCGLLPSATNVYVWEPLVEVARIAY